MLEFSKKSSIFLRFFLHNRQKNHFFPCIFAALFKGRLMLKPSWSDLNIFLEVARGPSLAAVSERLGVDVTTVRRRLAGLEEEIGIGLFEKHGRSLRLNAEGERIYSIASRMETLSEEISNSVTDASRDLLGVVRISTMEGFGSFYLAPKLGMLVAAHPNLSIQLVTAPHIVNLAEREADISLNMMEPQRGRFLVEKLTRFSVGLYAAPSYLERSGQPGSLRDLADHTFVTYVEDLIEVPYVQWLPDILDSPRVRLSCSSLVAQFQVTCAGSGLAMLPAFMAENEPRLTRLFRDEINLTRDWWMVVHRDLEKVPRIRAVMDFLRTITHQDAHILHGQGG
ncbi:LysR family transcriptional regulator [Alloalcanivorax sp. C16-1]|uniref:LysR family transcriptional regulator n=1 Tax=Alloalcanivorax sp. C16-1 TaxID=3390051 RepID=UPI003970E0AA